MRQHERAVLERAIKRVTEQAAKRGCDIVDWQYRRREHRHHGGLPELRSSHALLVGIIFLVLAVAAPASASVKIAKIQYNPPGKDTDDIAQVNREFVVIKNIGTHRVTLTGWRLYDTHRHTYLFPAFRLRPGNIVRIHTGRGTDDRNDLYWEQSLVLYIWNNDGDTATLRDDNGNLKDRCHYSGGGTSVYC